jgi:hypothetical protein
MKNFILFIYLFITFLLMCADETCILGAIMLIALLITVNGGFKAIWRELWSDEPKEQQKEE